MLDLGYKKVKTLDDVPNDKIIEVIKLKMDAQELFEECILKGVIPSTYMGAYVIESVELLKEKIEVFSKCLSHQEVDYTKVLERITNDKTTNMIFK